MPTVEFQTDVRSAPRHFHPTHPTLTTHDFTKSIYLNLLESFQDEDVIAFWEGLPMTWEGRQLSTHALLSLLWQEKAKVPLAWDYSVGEAVERLLVKHDVTIFDFYRKLLYRNNKSTYLPGSFLLKWCYPVIKSIFNADLRDTMIRLLPFFTENLLPHHINRRVKKVVHGEWIESVMVFITDDQFHEPLHFDIEVHGGEQTKASPGMIGLPHFEEVGILSDTRPLETVVWGGVATETDGVAIIDGRQVGHRISYDAFCHSHGINLSEYKVPPRECMLMDVDYRCPIRKRIVLHAGCAYDAPAGLITLRYAKSNASSEVLKHMVLDLEDDDASLAKKLESRHFALLSKVQEVAAFKYFPEDESITLNGEHLVKGVSAKILRTLLAAYLSDGRCDFEYREFKRDFEISMGQKNSNFEVRFYRLVERLKEKCPTLVIQKSGRGRFRLDVDCAVALEEGAA
jgi:hypothetical protein